MCKPRLKITFVSITDRGKRRENNENYLGHWEFEEKKMIMKFTGGQKPI